MEVNNNLTKIKVILQYVFEGKIIISENYREKLLKFLDDGDENSAGKHILDTPCFSDLVYHSLVNISNISTSAQVLLIQLVTILFKNELQFNKIETQAFKESFGILHSLGNNPQCSLHLPYIELVTVHITHRSGLKVIMKHGLWKNILQPNIHHKPKYLSRAAYNFMIKLVLKLDEYNLEADLLEVLESMVKPIVTSEYLNLQIIDHETDNALCDKMFPCLSIIVAIIKESSNCASNNKAISLLLDYFHLEQFLIHIYLITRNEELLKLIHTCFFPMCFLSLRHLLCEKKTDEFCNRMTICHRNNIVFAMNKRDEYAVIDYVVQSGIIWSGIEKSLAVEYDFPLTFERNRQNNEFSLQIVITFIVPILKYSELYAENVEPEDVIETFLLKVSKCTADYMFSGGYKYASLLAERGPRYLKQMAIKTLKELPRLKDHLNESQAGPIFQSLYYTLGAFILCDEAGGVIHNENTIEQEDLRVLSHLLEAMKMLLKKYTISWYENVEIVNVQGDLLNLLKQTFLTPKHMMQVLDLLDICVKKFLSPNMTLLVENNNRQHSTLNEIGEVIKMYVQHEEWEVRDSAFNLLNTCTEISFIKYIPLQRVIKDNNLILLTAKAGLTEPEFYPRCTALNCLAAATKINSIWQEVLVENVNIYLQLVSILKHHPEGMVRREAVKVLTAVYVNQKINTTLQNTFYEAMTKAALNDLHWEVQLAALNFWDKAIKKHLTNKGMLDGKFPAVTFSKEKRKIITLNKDEITRQLTSIMNDLSNIGCLTVLVECMNDINNIDVMIQALSIAKELIAILDIYDIVQVDIVTIKMEAMPLQCKLDTNILVDLNQNISSHEEDRNKVIDSILSADQTDLIMSLYDSQIKVEEMVTDERCYPCTELVNSNEFIKTFRNTDFSLLIDNKKKFCAGSLENLCSLLDDILDLKVTD